jgi:chromate reductase
MPATRKVGVFVGSLRKDSWTRKVANAIVSVSSPSLAFEFIDIGTISSYNADLETSPPADWVTFRQKASGVDALLFVTPEYNRSIPGVLKNAIDVGSRPSRKGALNGKPGAVVSVSPGNLSGFGANHHLRQVLVFLDVPTLQQPEAYIGGVDKLFDDKGKLTNEATIEFLRTFVNAFAAWIELILAAKK